MGNFTISNGQLQTSKKAINLTKVDFIVPRKGLILKQYIFIGDRQGNCLKLRVDNAEIERILAECKAVGAPVMKNIDKMLACDKNVDTLKDGKSVRIQKNALWLTDDYVIFVPERKVLGFDAYPTPIEIGEVRFSATNPAKKFGIIPDGYGTYFGTPTNQALFIHPTKETGTILNNYLTENGSPIGEEASVTYKDTFWLKKLLKPLLFRKHEEIGITDEGIIYKLKKGAKVDNIYLPFDKINYMDLKKGFFHSNKIRIYGEQNIITQLEFSNAAISKLKEILAKKNVEKANVTIQPSMLFGLFRKPFAHRTIFVFDDRITFTDTKAKKVISLSADDITHVCWKKKHFFYFVGYLYVRGIPHNFRDDQNGHIEDFAIRKIWFTKKNAVKNLISSKSASYNKRSFRKLCSFDEVKYS